MKKLMIVILFTGLFNSIQAQNQELTQLLQKTQQAYHHATYLGFHIQYRYANKNQPGNYIDSLDGDIFMDKDRLRFVMEGVETVTTEKYNIRVVPEEQLIYVAKASENPMPSPTAMLDSALAQTPGVQTSVKHQQNQSTLQLLFPPGHQYKSITMIIDASTGFFRKVVYEMYTQGLVAEDMIEKPGQPGMYQQEGTVEIDFSGYRQGAFDASRFDETRYFTRVAPGRFEPAAAYKDYKVFLASSNL